MASSGLLERLSNHRSPSPLLPLHNTTHSRSRSPNEYQMDTLSPRPDDTSSAPSDDSLPRAWMDEHDEIGLPRTSPNKAAAAWSGRDRSSMSPSARKPWNMFSGPPPPISASKVLRKADSRRIQSKSLDQGASALLSPVRAVVPLVGSVLFEARPEAGRARSDSHWRGVRRQEKALEHEVQQLLDHQAAALIAGSGGGGGGGVIVNDAGGLDADVRSDGSITPTGTLYSTKSSKQGMTASLYVPTRATASGDVIPVRQPTKARPPGLRATRSGLQRSILAMARLKQEQGAYLEAALAQRRDALQYLGDLSSRKADLDTELKDLDQGDEEPLGQELRELGEKQDILDREIRRLEENLAAMRNRRRWLSERMDSIRNKREAGLSGYRGALKEVDAEVTALMRRPPIQPLDPDIFSTPGPPGASPRPESSGGAEFMQLNPERRTLEMARSWWESEAAALEDRRSRIDADRQALEEGSVVWDMVMQLVSDFESGLRKVTQRPLTGGPSPMPPTLPPPSKPSTTLGKRSKEKTSPSQEETVKNQLPQMKSVMEELERHMALAQEKRWNLLICAIGAELEAFREAFDMLESFVRPSELENSRTRRRGVLSVTRQQNKEQNQEQGQEQEQEQEQEEERKRKREQERDARADMGTKAAADDEDEETDNEVPQDLLCVPLRESSQEHEDLRGDVESVPLPRSGSDSENEVPLEFLAEHVLH